MSILPIFTSHYSVGHSLLTLEEPGKGKAGGPVSVFDLAQSVGLKEVVLVDGRPDGFVQAYKVSTKMGVKLCFGIKMVVCANAEDKSDDSLRSESKAVVFARDTEGYHKLVSVWNRASTAGFYYSARTSWAWLKEQWSDHLLLALPWASSFIARNTLTFNAIVPTLPAAPWVFKETDTDLPFARLIDAAIDRYVADTPGAQVVPMKSIYYARDEDLKPYVVLRAIHNRATFERPKVDHLSSCAFSFQRWRTLCQPTPSTA
jgi:DNA polymerase III alpha subunit